MFKDLVENISGNKIKVLRTDNGNDYVNRKLQKLSHESVIHMQHYVNYTPQQNGVVERKNRALKEMATCMLEDKDLSPNIWDEAINYYTYVKNRYSYK